MGGALHNTHTDDDKQQAYAAAATTVLSQSEPIIDNCEKRERETVIRKG